MHKSNLAAFALVIVFMSDSFFLHWSTERSGPRLETWIAMEFHFDRFAVDENLGWNDW